MSFAFRVLIVLALHAPSVALAQLSSSFGNPYVEPPVVQAGQSVTLVLLRVPCGPYDAPVFTVNNFVVYVTQAVPPACIAPAQAGELLFSLGTFPPGTYTLIYQPTNILSTGGSWPSQSTQFTVQAPRPIPVNALWTLVVLGVALLLAPLAARNTAPRP